MEKVKMWSKGLLIVINVCLILICIKFYFDYALIYEYQVHQAKIMYPNDADITTRGTEINNIFLFVKIVMAGLVVNLIASIIFLNKRKEIIKEN
jgi:hypothetical protein